jgi:MtN3 and saliva related transmembrane protein
MEIMGFVAGLLTLLTYVPQSVKTLKTRKTDDLSLPTLVLLSTSALLWVVYGLGSGLLSVWLTNVVVCALGGAILMVKIREGGTADHDVAAQTGRN